MKCEYCGNAINSKFSDRKIHKLCQKLKEFSNGRNLTENGDYWMSYVPPEKEGIWPNLSVNSRNYCYSHELIARLILGRDLNSQDSDDPEIVDHINMGDGNKADFSPANLRVMKLNDHVSEHKRKGSPRRR